jgi:hypothetical protein
VTSPQVRHRVPSPSATILKYSSKQSGSVHTITPHSHSQPVWDGASAFPQHRQVRFRSDAGGRASGTQLRPKIFLMKPPPGPGSGSSGVSSVSCFSASSWSGFRSSTLRYMFMARLRSPPDL